MGNSTEIDNQQTVLIFGANGRLGSAIQRCLITSGFSVKALRWQAVKHWVDPKKEKLILFKLIEFYNNGLNIIFANGDTDPRQSKHNLIVSNYEFPKRVISVASKIKNVRFLTIGTTLEQFKSIAIQNVYVASKAILANWLRSRTDLNGKAMHLQLHTLYGGVTSAPHMFLGQIVSALRNGTAFPMTKGHQLREYHHVDDIAGSIERLLYYSRKDYWQANPILPISSGHCVKLADIATAIFLDFGRLNDLRIGSLPSPSCENFTHCYPATESWLLKPSRESLKGIVAWAHLLLDGKLEEGAYKYDRCHTTCPF